MVLKKQECYRKQILRKSILQSPALCGEIDRREKGREIGVGGR